MPRKGYVFTPAHKAALSAAKKGKPRPPANVAAVKATWARKRVEKKREVLQ